MDEPTTGLHTAELNNISTVMSALADSGNTVLVMEHKMDVIKTAYQIIDIRPEGGSGGGTIVVTGTPEEVAKCPKSYTGQYLANILENKS